jgi:uncharacterized protein YbjT (DUF2867 family)
LIYAAKQGGVRRIIKLSVAGAEFVCQISAFARWHADIEEVLRTSDIAHVILRPNFFMQNTLLQRASIEAGVYVEPISTNSISYVDIHDIADVAVAAARGDFDDQALTLTSVYFARPAEFPVGTYPKQVTRLAHRSFDRTLRQSSRGTRVPR